MHTFTNSVFKNLYGETLLTSLFFSQTNINNIQILLKKVIFKELGGIVIDDQSISELLIVMRSLFLSESKHPPLINKNMTKEQVSKLQKQYTEEVARLNVLVINTTVPMILSSIKQYLAYKNQLDNPIQINPKPESTTIKGENSYELYKIS